jgi:hypothetical protein
MINFINSGITIFTSSININKYKPKGHKGAYIKPDNTCTDLVIWNQPRLMFLGFMSEKLTKMQSSLLVPTPIQTDIIFGLLRYPPPLARGGGISDSRISVS